MSIISKETWDKFTQEEKQKIINDYQNLIDIDSPLASEFSDEERMGARFQMEWLIGKENLQPKPTYEEICKALASKFPTVQVSYCSGELMAKKMKAIHELLMVAKFLNKDWKPDWSNNEDKWSLCVDPDTNKVRTIKVYHSEINRYVVYFRTEELANQAVTILGEDIIRLVLTTEY